MDYGPQLTDFDVIPPALCEKFMNRESLNISQFSLLLNTVSENSNTFEFSEHSIGCEGIVRSDKLT